MKIRYLFVLGALSASSIAYGQQELCPPLAKLARAVAVERETGKTKEQTYLSMVQSGRIDPKSPSADFAANTVVWVYNEKVSSQAAEKKMLAKCRAAMKKH